MKKMTVIIISLLLVILQVTLTCYFKIGWLNYNFALTSVIMTAWVFKDKALAYANAVLVGFLIDLFSTNFLGYNIVIYLLLVTLLLFLSGQMYRKSFKICIMLSFFVTVVTEFITYLFLFAPDGLADNAFVLSKIIFPQGLVNCIPGTIVYYIFVALDRRFKNKKRW